MEEAERIAVKQPQKRTHPKRNSALATAGDVRQRELERMANEARYESSDYHRPLPDGSSVPQRRPDKTVCQAHQGQYPNAIKLLKKGFRRGMVSVQRRGEWPRNVWAVDANGMAYEAQLTNQDSGQYHGYPMRETAAFTRHVLAEWKKRG